MTDYRRAFFPSPKAVFGVLEWQDTMNEADIVAELIKTMDRAKEETAVSIPVRIPISKAVFDYMFYLHGHHRLEGKAIVLFQTPSLTREAVHQGLTSMGIVQCVSNNLVGGIWDPVLTEIGPRDLIAKIHGGWLIEHPVSPATLLGQVDCRHYLILGNEAKVDHD